MDTPAARSMHEVAEYLSVSYRTVHNLIKRGDLKAHKIGRRVRIFEEDLDRYLKSSRARNHG